MGDGQVLSDYKVITKPQLMYRQNWKLPLITFSGSPQTGEQRTTLTVLIDWNFSEYFNSKKEGKTDKEIFATGKTVSIL